MHAEQNSVVLDAVLDAWDRSNRALVNLLRALPTSALDARARDGGATVGQMCAHLHHERMVSVAENAPEFARPVPSTEWADVDGVDQLAARFDESASLVRAAVEGRIETGRPLDRNFGHPIQLVTFLIFHDAYHHGQIKLAVQRAGLTLSDEVVSKHVWDVWRSRQRAY